MVLLVLLVLSSAIYFGQDGVSDSENLLFQNPLKPRYIYFSTYGLTVFLCFGILIGKFQPFWIVRSLPGKFADKGFISLMLILGVYHLVWYPFVPDNQVEARLFVLRMNVVVMTICGQIILWSVTDMQPILKAVRIVVWGTCLLNAAIIFYPGLFSVRMAVASGRAAGLYWDSNECAIFIAMALPLLNVGQSGWMRVLHTIVTLLGVAFTFSRGGILIWLLAVILSSLLRPGFGNIAKHKFFINIILLSVFLVVASAFMVPIWNGIVDFLYPHLNSDTYARLRGGDEGSSDERLLVARLGWAEFTNHPFIGGGYGVVHIWGYHVSVHNMFILLMNEFGIFGLCWYVFFILRVFSLPLRFGSLLGCLLILVSLFTHTWFDLYYCMLLVQLYWRTAWIMAANMEKIDAQIALLEPVLPARLESSSHATRGAR
jgi:hypothetical protein